MRFYIDVKKADIPWMSRKFVKFSSIGKHPFLREIDTLADWFELEGVHALPVQLHLPLSPPLSLQESF